MHKSVISEAVRRRAIARRGGIEVFSSLDPQHTALLVIDLQNMFMEPGQVAELPSARAIVPQVNRMAAELRAKGGTVVWIQHTRPPVEGTRWQRFLEFSVAGWGDALWDAATPGHPGHALHAQLDVQPVDEILLKYRFSAFIQGSSDLHERLQQRGIDTVIVTGTVTNVCCESTARDAMMLDYRVLFVSDANAAHSDAEHNATLENMVLWFADVRDSEGIIALLNAA